MSTSSLRIVSARWGRSTPCPLPEYTASGGYEAAKQALSMSRRAVLEEVRRSNLRGRGRTGGPTAVKWGMVPRDAPTVFLVGNGMASEPGAYKDRELLTQDPHLVLEGMIIAAHALGVRYATLAVRASMRSACDAVDGAVEEAYAAGLLGQGLDIAVVRGLGAYVCGEETALLSMLEGRRPQPRPKPPVPAVRGLWGRPTIVHNVETLANLPWIVRHGGDAFASIGMGRSGGLRLLSVSGHVRRPGVYELPMAVCADELIDEVCGGVRGDAMVKAVLPGGISTPVLGADELDVPLEFDALTEDPGIRSVEVRPGMPVDLGIGRPLRTHAGSGAVIVMDETTDIPLVASQVQAFFRDQSCGWCTPCREGTAELGTLAHRIAHGHGQPGDLDRMATMADGILGASVCPLGDTAAGSLLAFVTKFRGEFEARIKDASARRAGSGGIRC